MTQKLAEQLMKAGWELAGVRRLVDFTGVVKPALERWINYRSTLSQGVEAFEFSTVGHSKNAVILHGQGRQAIRSVVDVAMVWRVSEPTGFAGKTFALCDLGSFDLVHEWLIAEANRAGVPECGRVRVHLELVGDDVAEDAQ